MQKLIACLILGLGVSAATTWADSHEKSAAAGGRVATVAGGQTVILAPSAKTAEEWASQRPDYQALRPAKR